MSRVPFRRKSAASLVILALALGGCGVIGGKKGPKSTPTLGDRVPVLSRIESGAKVDPSLAAIAVVLPPAETNTEWAQAGGNAAKSYGHLALGDAPQRAWTASIAGSTARERLAASPVVGGGQLFVFDTAGEVHAFDAATGRENWKVSLRGSENNNSVFGGGVTFADGRVYATTGLGEVAALDASNGSQLWRVKPAGPLRGSPTVAFNSVFVMTQDNQIHALNASDGSPEWNESASTGSASVFGVGAPAAGQGTVVAGYSSGELTAYRYENGRALWADALARTSISTSVSTLTDIDADPIIDRGRVYALGQGGRMAAYELVTGQRIWELSLAGISTPAIAGEWIFTLTDDARLLCLARTTGKARWITQLPHWKNEEKKDGPIFWTGPVLANNKLWVANSRGEVQSVAVADGTPSPFVKLGAPVSLAPIVANATLYILDDSGKITAFR
ncbi:PQQ-binding-like beta-propeller repeat protein [Novosphingobium tardum]|uniref:PQQ-binding-like beta-propeller repeat protein n=1 Tax=Novosphingobium tardum TaxID=1538021 RepID=A0ABV8RTB2_9SPHN